MLKKNTNKVTLDCEKVEELITKLGLSKAEMSRNMGCSNSYISNTLGGSNKNGKGVMRTAFAKLLATELGVTLDDIIAIEPIVVEPSTIDNPTTNDINDAYNPAVLNEILANLLYLTHLQRATNDKLAELVDILKD